MQTSKTRFRDGFQLAAMMIALVAGVDASYSRTPMPSAANVPPPSPTKQRETFKTVIPFVVMRHYAGIPIDDSHDDPLRLSYVELASIANLELGLQFDPHSQKWITVPPPNDAAITDFIARVLQYYVLRSIAIMRYPVNTYDVIQNGIVIEKPYIVNVPDEQDYPMEKLNALLDEIGLQFTPASGQADQKWTLYPLKVPKDTIVKLTSTRRLYKIRFERSQDFFLDFTISPGGPRRGAMPAHFRPVMAEAIQSQYSSTVTISMDFEWHGKPGSAADEYREWAEGLFIGLKRQLTPPAGKN